MQQKNTPEEKNHAAERIRLALAHRNMTQRELCRASGISAGYLSDILRLKKPLTSHAAHKLAPALRVPFVWLFIGHDPAPTFAGGESRQTAETAVCPPDFSRVLEPASAYSARQRGIAGAPPPLVDAMRLMAEKLSKAELDSIADTLKSLGGQLNNPDEEETLFSTVTFLRRVKAQQN